MTERLSESGAWQFPLPADYASESALLVRVSWLFGGLVLLAAAISQYVSDSSVAAGALYLTGASILVFNGLVWWLGRRYSATGDRKAEGIPRGLLPGQLIFDGLAIVAIVHWTGGIGSPAILLLLIHLQISALVLSGKWLYAFLLLDIGALALVAVLESEGILPHYASILSLPVGFHADKGTLATVLSLVTLASTGIVCATTAWAGRIRRRERRSAQLLQITQALASADDRAELLEHLAHGAAGMFSEGVATVRLPDEVSGVLKTTAAYGEKGTRLDEEPVELSPHLLDEGVLAKGPVVIGNIAADERVRHRQPSGEEEIKSLLAAPLMHKGELLGVLTVYSLKPNRFSPADVSFLLEIARQGAGRLAHLRAFEHLQQAEQTQAQFVRMVTHELKTPVAGAQSLLRTLLRGLIGDLSEQQRDILERIDERFDLLSELISDLLVLAANRTIWVDERLESVPLQPIIREVIDYWATTVENKGMRVRFDPPPEILNVQATQEGLERAFSNLIDNAIKYTPAGGEIEVTIETNPTSAVITVSDSGIGIPSEDLPHLWDEFFRARNAREAGITGTGLGLSIVRQLVSHFGGAVDISSKEGAGTKVKVTLLLG